MNLLQRKNNDLLIRHIDLLREAVGWVRRTHPFTIHGWVVFPDHFHCVISLLPGDADFAPRWRLIKMRFLKPSRTRNSALKHGNDVASEVFSSGVIGKT